MLTLDYSGLQNGLQKLQPILTNVGLRSDT